MPCRRDGKAPTTKHGKDDATTDPDKLAAMINAGDNIAIAWDVGVLALDIDVPKDEHDEPMPGAAEHADAIAADLEARFVELRHAPRQRTRSDGLTYVIALPEGVTVPSKVRAVEDVDLRGDGRTYTLVEPSTIRGRAYRWDADRPLVARDQLPIASAELIEYFTPAPSDNGVADLAGLHVGGAGAPKVIDGDPARYAAGLLDNVRQRLGAVRKGRNAECSDEALTLGRWVGGYQRAGLPGLTREDAYAALLDAMKANGDHAEDPRKAEGTITRRLGDGMASAYTVSVKPRASKRAEVPGPPPRDDSDPGPGDADAPSDAAVATSAESAAPKRDTKAVTRQRREVEPLATLRELNAREFEPVDAVIENAVLPGLNVLAGKPKLGKSWLALGMALAVANGGRFWDRETKQGRAIYYGLEDSWRRLQARLRKMGPDAAAAMAADMLHLGVELPRLDGGGLDHLRGVLTRYPDTRMLVLDTLARVKPMTPAKGTTYDSDSVLGADLQAIAKEHDVALLVVTHLRKMGADDPLDMVSGSLGLVGSADSVMVLQRKRGEADATFTVAARDLEDREDALRFDVETGTWHLMGAAADYAQSKQRLLILEAVRDLQAVRGASTGPSAIAEHLGDAVKVNAVRQLMPKMVRDGALAVRGRGQYYDPTHPVDNVAFVAERLPYRED